MDKVSEELQRRIKMNEILEHDINRIKIELANLEKEIDKSNQQIRIDTSNSQKISWNSLILITGKESQIIETPPVHCPYPTNRPQGKEFSRLSMFI